MVDWTTGKPTASIWVLRLLHDNFGPGDNLVEINPVSQFSTTHPYVFASAILTRQGHRKVLLVNRHNGDFDVSVPGATGGRLDYVDVTSTSQAPGSIQLTSGNLTLHGFSVAVLALP